MGPAFLRDANKIYRLTLIKPFSKFGFNKLKHTCKVECPEGDVDKLDLTCKVALITGGATGIGFCVASELLCAGIRHVAITDINKCKGKESMIMLNNLHGKNKVKFYESNIANTSEMQETFKTITDKHKRLDILVNCAGVCDGPCWEKEILINLVGVMRSTLLAYRYMGKEGQGKGGTVINYTGVHGLEPLPPAPTLSASYHGVVGFSRSFGHKSHVARSGIRVITLCTGFTKTEFLKKIEVKSLTASMGVEFEKYIKASKIQNPGACGEAVLHLLRCAKSGSVWVCEGSSLYKIHFPPRESYSELISQFL